MARKLAVLIGQAADGPRRADARRNRERVLVAAEAVFAESGIKTMQMTDGTVREEPFDPSSTPEGRAVPDLWESCPNESS